MKTRLFFFCCMMALAPDFARAAPSLADQTAWTEGDKKEFLDFLNTGRGAPVTGQVKDVASPESREMMHAQPRKPYYLTLEAATAFTVMSSSGTPVDHSVSIGPRLIFGGHLFSWVRYFLGFDYSSVNEEHFDGTNSGVDHFHIPLGLELALIPLGAPHTQYFILRGALGTHLFNTGTPASTFKNPLLGFQESWNLGLGYEWQIKESHFRIHVLADSEFAFDFQLTRFYSVGLTGGLSYTF